MAHTETFDPLRRVQAYQLALEAVREGRDDARIVAADPVLRDVGTQLVRAVASIAANIAEGYSRGSSADRRRFLEYALGSTRETIVWYEAAGLAESPREDRATGDDPSAVTHDDPQLKVRHRVRSREVQVSEPPASLTPHRTPSPSPPPHPAVASTA